MLLMASTLEIPNPWRASPESFHVISKHRYSLFGQHCLLEHCLRECLNIFGDVSVVVPHVVDIVVGFRLNFPESPRHLRICKAPVMIHIPGSR